MKGLLVYMLMLFATLALQAQNKYGLKTTDYAAYQTTVKVNPNKKLVNLATYIPNLVLDIRYATPNNFTGQTVYQLARAYARQPVADALKRAQAVFNQRGLGIKIYDAYRPYAATVKFYELYRDTTYVASPYRGSRHNRGCAIDMTLIDLKTGEELKMPTPYDSFQKAAWPTSPVADPVVRRNRQTLIDVMQQHGFRVNSSEWWHFDFIGYRQYEVLDIAFEQLEP